MTHATATFSSPWSASSCPLSARGASIRPATRPLLFPRRQVRHTGHRATASRAADALGMRLQDVRIAAGLVRVRGQLTGSSSSPICLTIAVASQC
eukprot:75480-Prymnesium_polylepis.1